MSLTLRDSVNLLSDPENLNASVFEVFEKMLGMKCELEQPDGVPFIVIDAGESVTAVVGFGGVLSGACMITCDGSTARRMASLMTGMEFDVVDDVVKDGIGEICNMLAGTWKSRIPGLAANCGLSLPAVITGRDYNLHVQAPEFKIRHCYKSDEAKFQVTVVCDGIA
jgi:chemotaxis protein CheX